MKKTLTKNHKEIVYHLISKDIKNINVRIKKDGSVCVSKPHHLDENVVETFLMERFEWIERSQKRLNDKRKHTETMITNNSVVIFNQRFRIIKHQGKRNVFLNEDEIHLYAEKDEHYETVLNDYLNQCLKLYCEEKRTVYDQILDDYHIQHPVIKVRKMVRRWGSCLVNKHIIHLSHLLVHCSKEEIDYVLLHEYIHFIEPNHSKAFYQLVEDYMPNYKKSVQLLKSR